MKVNLWNKWVNDRCGSYSNKNRRVKLVNDYEEGKEWEWERGERGWMDDTNCYDIRRSELLMIQV